MRKNVQVHFSTDEQLEALAANVKFLFLMFSSGVLSKAPPYNEVNQV
jgi:hypothetical protein